MQKLITSVPFVAEAPRAEAAVDFSIFDEPTFTKLGYHFGMPEKNDFRLDYLEFGCIETVRVKSFYHTVFGWQFTDYGPGYTCFSDGRLRGGFTTDLKPADGSPLAVIYAWDLKQVQAKIVAAGGSVVKETFYFPGGSRFHFADPEGNVLAVWSDSQDQA